MSSNQGENFEDLTHKLENASKDEAKSIIIDMILPECRGLAKSFFDCVEEKTQNNDFKDSKSFDDWEKAINDKFIPECMTLYDLNGCLDAEDKKRGKSNTNDQ